MTIINMRLLNSSLPHHLFLVLLKFLFLLYRLLIIIHQILNINSEHVLFFTKQLILQLLLQHFLRLLLLFLNRAARHRQIMAQRLLKAGILSTSSLARAGEHGRALAGLGHE